MPHTSVMPQYTVTFTAAEYRLVTMALAGILKDKADIKAAVKLNEQLCNQRAAMLSDSLEKAEQALSIAKEINQDEVQT